VRLRSLVPLVFLLAAGTAGAQAPASVLPDHPSPETIEIYLVTIGQGDEVWNRFGHNAIWVRDETEGWDVAYNYGLFDFDQPGFLRRFIQGRMQYWMGPMDAPWMLEIYRRENRDILVQRLNLTPEAALRLVGFLEWNALPENREYRYDYYLDNCSTRVRDAIDIALDGAIRRQTQHVAGEMTFREHSLRLVGDDLPYYTGLHVGLGPFVDRPATRWDEMFLPEKVAEYLRDVQVPGADGAAVPLVGEPLVLFQSDRPPPLAAPPRRVGGFALVGILLGGLLVLLGWLAPLRRGAAIGFTGGAVLWSVIAGIAGLLLVFLWVATDHGAAHRNENLFHLSPLAMALAVLLPGALRRPAWSQWAVLLAWAVAAVSLLGLVLGAFPFLPQWNSEIAALALPLNLGLAVGMTLRLGLPFPREMKA